MKNKESLRRLGINHVCSCIVLLTQSGWRTSRPNDTPPTELATEKTNKSKH